MTEESPNTDGEDVYEPTEILVAHIGDPSRTSVCSRGEDGQSCEDAVTTTTKLSPPTVKPLETPESGGDGMPSVERRRRRRRANNDGILYNDHYVNNDFTPITWRPRWRSDTETKFDTAILGMIVVLAIRFFAVRDKIMHDIRRTRHEALTNNDRQLFLPRSMRQIPYIVPILLKHLLNGDFLHHSILRLISNPLQLPQIIYELLVFIWGMVCDFLRQLQYILRSIPIFRLLHFGIHSVIRSGDVASDVVPELEEKANNNDACAHNDNVEGKAVTGNFAAKAGIKSSHASRIARYNINDLPPAFENEEDYPVGWLMYHPKHGVRTREYLMELERREKST